MRLQTRYSLILGSMILIVVFTMAGLLLIQFDQTLQTGMRASDQTVQRELYQRLENKGQSINRVLASNLINPLYSFDTNEMFEQLQSVLKLPDIEYAIIYDLNGTIIHEGDEEMARFGQMPDDPFVAATLNGNHSLVQKAGNILDISTPLFIGEERLGGVRIGLSLDSANGDIREMHAELEAIFAAGIQRNLVTVGITSILMVLLFGGFLAAWVSRSISRPIHQLADYAQQVGQDLEKSSISLPKARNDELGELAQSFSDMLVRLEKSNKQVSYQAHHDQLTSLPNRLMLNRFLDQALERATRHKQKLAVIFLDIDDFKRINDTLGHSAGDDLLQQFSQRLQSCLRGDDCLVSGQKNDSESAVARLGGDEFTVMLDGIESAVSAAIVAERILIQARTPFQLSGGQEVVVGASIGITLYPEDGLTRPQLLRNADIAMYSAKSAGKNNFAFYTTGMNDEAQQRLAMERDLRRAIDQQELQLYYQPLFDQKGMRIVGVEALLRWPQADSHFISPEKFIPIAEQTGLIIELGNWVLATACEQTKAWQSQGLADLYCAVNLSGVQLRRRQIVTEIKELLERTKLSPDYLHVELTETAILTNEEDARSILADIHALGVDIWMDDFGTGYSSLSFLKKFSVQGVKVDRSFVSDMTESDDSRAIVNATIAMAKNLNLRTTAEGVETQGQLALLNAQGCDILQGYYLGKPMSATQLKQLMLECPEMFAQASRQGANSGSKKPALS